MSQPKLIKGRKYVITGAADDQQLKEMTKRGGVKFPQTVLFNGVHFEVKDSDGVCKWDVSFFTFKEYTRKAKVEIYKSRGAIRFRVKGANGKLLNHQYNDKRGCNRGIKALEAALRDYEIVDLTK